MVDIKTRFVGLELQSPIVVGSCGLTHNLDKMRAMVAAGAGAVVLKSLFEEQILAQGHALEAGAESSEAADYIAHYTRAEEVGRYLEQIARYKRELGVPIIASINCVRGDSWTDFAAEIEAAGADALEVNIMRLETDLYFDPVAGEALYVDIVRRLRAAVRLPLIVKLSKYHTALPALVDKLRAAGAAGVTLFNRTYQADIDLEAEAFTSADVFTSAGSFVDTLRFTALVSGRVGGVEIAASTGVHSWAEVAKSLLAGAEVVQMCTAVYKEGSAAISHALEGLSAWLARRGYTNVEEVRGRLSAGGAGEENVFERVQFRKYFGAQGEGL